MSPTPTGDGCRDWFVRLDSLPERAINELASRLVSLNPSTRIASVDSTIWVRTNGPGSDILPALRQLPGVLFSRHPSGDLVRLGETVPSLPDFDAHVPKVQWQPVADVCDVTIPIPQLAPGNTVSTQQTVRLIRGGTMTQCDAMRTRLATLLEWIELAPKARIDSLRWSIRRDECLVMGNKLPPIDGTYFVTRGRVIVPAGMTWTPSVPSHILLTSFEVPADDWLLWESDERWSIVPDDAITAMSRSSVRMAVRNSPVHCDSSEEFPR
ncbi:hypothetical protein [Aporhodopirellula aestuarii]|uniref:MoxR-vWA-beta-propeller ternary system domain-containing protein n=1 Tax=Aporhodopirellula aestuarii TaxID=2950107 RepID=A0ABT0U3Y4_9BACT|nr:hypothetical protein [Aporhodopirellula aestuarii]MCM2371607.1 hypothetical protein [Aporhodopirellula aestuarii]